MKSMLMISVCILTLCAAAVTFADGGDTSPCASYEDAFHWQAFVPGVSQYFEVSLGGGYLYAAARTHGVQVYDLQNPSLPVRVAEVPELGDVLAIHVLYSVCLAYGSGISVIDILDPASASLLLTLPATGSHAAVEYSDHLFLGTSDGLRIVDLTDRSAPEVLAADPLPEEILGLARRGDELIALTATRLVILGLADPAAPVQISDLAMATFFNSEMCVTDDRAFITTATDLVEIDVSDPATPQVTSELAYGGGLPGFESNLLVKGNRAFVKMEGIDPTIEVIDIGSPGQPQALGTVDADGWTTLIDYLPPYLYVDSGPGDFVVDAGGPGAPEIVTWTGVARPAYGGGACSDTHLYQGSDTGLFVFDLGQIPLVPPLGRADTPGIARGVAVTDDYAYVGDWADGVQVIDPDAQAIVGSLPIEGTVTSLVAADGYLYVGDMANGVVVADLAQPDTPVQVATVPLENGADVVAVAADRVLVASGAELVLLDRSDPTAPQILGTWTAPAAIRGVAGTGDRVVLTSGDEVVIVDAADPAAISPLGSVQLNRNGYELQIVDDLAYVVAGGVSIVDISDPAAPAILSRVATGSLCSTVAVHDGICYADGGDGGVRIIDVHNALQPELIGRGGINRLRADGNINDMRGIAVARGRIFVCDEFGLQMLPLECAEETGPIEVVVDLKPGDDDNAVNCGSHGVQPVAILTTAEFDALSVDHETVVFGPGLAHEAHMSKHGLKRHEEDVDLDGDLDLMFHFDTQEAQLDCSAERIELFGSTFDGREIHGSVTFHPVPTRRSPNLMQPKLSAAPNPFNPQTKIMFELPERGAVRLSVFDMAGRRVRTLISGAMRAAGANSVVWNGRDDTGRGVASGTYFYRLEVGSFGETRRIVLLK